LGTPTSETYRLDKEEFKREANPNSKTIVKGTKGHNSSGGTGFLMKKDKHK
jgi:hypothetical protein